MCGRSTDLIHENVTGLSVAHLEVSMCVCTCLNGCSVCNHSIKSTAITNRISWVDSRSLSLLIDFLRFPSVHQGRTFCEWPQWESLPRGRANVSEGGFKAGRPSFCVRKSQISQSYHGQQMPLSRPACLTNAVWLHHGDQPDLWIFKTVKESKWISSDTGWRDTHPRSQCLCQIDADVGLPRFVISQRISDF